MGIRVVFIIT